jgi:hypothetical protein
MNATLQALGNIPAFSSHYARSVFDARAASSGALYDNEAAPLAYTLGEVYAMVWSGKRVVFTPDHFLHAVWAAHAPFRGFKQQDAHEVGGGSDGQTVCENCSHRYTYD